MKNSHDYYEFYCNSEQFIVNFFSRFWCALHTKLYCISYRKKKKFKIIIKKLKKIEIKTKQKKKLTKYR